MAGQESSQVGVLLVTGMLAILGTVAGGVVQGWIETDLADKQFQTSLILRALESDDAEERVESLQFIIDTKLITDTDIRSGFDTYMKSIAEDGVRTLPQFRPAVGVSEAGVVVAATTETVKFTDFDVFKCDVEWESEAAEVEVQAVIQSLTEMERVGQIRLKKWTLYHEVTLEELRGKLTVIVDNGHGEAQEVPRLRQAFAGTTELPEMVVRWNDASPTEWLVAIVVCPQS